MPDIAGNRYWLIGASDGLGAALARKMSEAGAEVILSARSEDKLKELVSKLPNPASAVTIDIADQSSVEAAASEVGEIDGMVFLAGVYWPMKATGWDSDQATAMLDINLTGAVRVLGEIVPKMIAKNSGHIVLTGSLSGFRGLPGSIGYGASKAGIMYLAESMNADLRDTGVKVQLANPGFIKTRLTDKNDFKMPFIMEPDEAAQVMLDHIQSDKFKRSFPTMFSLVFRLSQFMPDWMYYRLFS